MNQVPTIHGIPAPQFCSGINQNFGPGPSGVNPTAAPSGGPGQPFVFAEDFEDMDLGSAGGCGDATSAFPPVALPPQAQPIPVRPQRDYFIPTSNRPNAAPRNPPIPSARQPIPHHPANQHHRL